METLLEDYKRRLQTAENMVSENTNSGSINDIKRTERLQTKASEYRTFIVEIERAIARISNEDRVLHLQRISHRNEQLAISALDKIAHPIKYLQSEAEKDGAKLDGYMAIQITQDANFYQEIADKALKAIANCG